MTRALPGLGKRARVLIVAAALALLAAIPTFATRYCMEESIDGCVQKVTCDYYENGKWVGSVVIRYDCRPAI